ncbi:SAM-dependent methyltransferase [Nonomuraea sp. NPDC049400]|uniref:SAM-dependent methyltransferase n=1 Tax=Nonomuraea sp. NPDC049400 TaxID=3364352 RepID=UPI00379F88FF
MIIDLGGFVPREPHQARSRLGRRKLRSKVGCHRASTPETPPLGIYPYVVGGKDYFEADREAAEVMLAGSPYLGVSMRVTRAFLQRAVRWLADPRRRQHRPVPRHCRLPHRTCTRSPRA